MSIIWIILISVVTLSFFVIIIIFSAKFRKTSLRARQAVIELYNLKTEYSYRHKIFELNKAIFSGYQVNRHKSQLLILSEQLKNSFRLGKFVAFCSQRSMLQPTIALGYKLKAIKPFKIDIMEKLLADRNNSGKSSTGGFVLNNEQIKQLTSVSQLQNDIGKLFGYCYKTQKNLTLFIGEDPKGELARYCTNSEFNRAIWPLVNNVCHNHNRVKKFQDKVKSLHDELQNARGELKGITRKLKYKSFDLHSFYDISNKLFSIYDESQLLGAIIKSLENTLKPSIIAIMTSNDEDPDTYQVVAVNKKVSTEWKKTKFPVDSHIRKLLDTRKQAVVLPLLSSGLPDDNPFVELALTRGFLVMEKLVAGDKTWGLVLIGEKVNGKNYEDSELELFSTLTNVASLAMNNIHQYNVIEKMSYTDFLTEVYNYRYFYKRLREEIFRAKRFNRMLALVIFDIDNFKSFNDTYGHQAGDEVLKNLASLVTGSVRAIDIVSRYGGEEFCIIMPDTGFANCLILVERLRKMIEGYKFTSDHVDEGYSITVSIGSAVYPVDAKTPERLIYCADMALLKAKHDGRNRSMMFNSSMLEDKALIESSQQQLTDMGIYEDL